MTHHSRSAPKEGTVEALAWRRLSFTLAATALLALTAAATAPLRAASYRLSQGLPFSDVTTPRQKLSSDGRYAVFVQDAVVEGARELWSVPVAGGDPVRLSGLLPSGSSIASFEVASDSQRVVYRAPQDSTGVFELFGAPIAGPEGSWTKLSPPLAAGGDVDSFTISPDGSRVAFVADVETVDVRNVWSVPIDGGTALRHRPAVTLAGSTVSGAPQISPDGERVLFLANFSNLDKSELWSARLDGTGGVTKLSGLLPEGGDVTSFSISATSASVVYRADQEVDGRIELYSVAIGGGASTKLNGALVSTGDVYDDFAISPNSTRVVYLADQELDERVELYSVPLAGGAAVKLNGGLVSEGDALGFAISADSSRVVYRADQQINEVSEIYSVPLAGGGFVKLNSALTSGGDVSYDFAISPDSSRVVYRADQQTDEVTEIYSVPLSGGAVVRINASLVVGGDVDSFQITSGSDFVIYLADLQVDHRLELYRSDILGGTAADDPLNGPIVPGGSVSNDLFQFARHPDNLRVLYAAIQEVPGRRDIYIGDPCILCDGFEGGSLLRWQ